MIQFLSIFRVFRVKREERLLALVGILYFVSLNSLMIYKYYDMFTRIRKGGFWSLFWNHFRVSGFDSFTYITLCKWDTYYVISRHPLLAFMMWPFHKFNLWLTSLTGKNCAVFIVGFLLTVFAFYSLLFIYRIFREVIQLQKIDSWLLTWLFFSFGYVMLTVIVPDHFCFSLFLLTIVLYISGVKILRNCKMKAWQTALLCLFTAGVTLTNGVKVLLAQLFANGRSFFSWRNIAVSVFIPTIILGTVIVGVQSTFGKRLEERGKKMNEYKMQKDSTFRKRSVAFGQRSKDIAGENMGDVVFLKWADTSTPRVKSITENLWGESFQLHRNHLLEDIHFNRPVFVEYDSWYQYVVGIVLAILFVVGIVAGWRYRFLWLCLSWFAFDMLMHVGFGFGLNEVYIMTAHWAFVIPIAIAYLMKKQPAPLQILSLSLTFSLAAFLWWHNLSLITKHILG